MNQETLYNPLDKVHLGASVADALLSRRKIPMSDIQSFIGAGIYALYYIGDFLPYKPISDINREEIPIYVGKAVPPGARKGKFGLDANPGTVLHKRLGEHVDSIERVLNLEIDDFLCRYIVVDDIWIPLGESLLIAKFSPI